MNFYTKSGDNFSEKSHYGHIKGVETYIGGIESYTHYYRMLNLDWKEIPVKLVTVDANIKHPSSHKILNLVFENIDHRSENFGDQYLAKVKGWKLHKIQFIFEQHPFQILASSGFWIIVLIVIYLIFGLTS